MKRYPQKFVSMLLTLILVVSLIPYPVSYAVGTGGVQEKMSQIMSDFPKGSYFTVNGAACTHDKYHSCSNCSLLNISKAKGKSVPPGQGNAWTCVGFASYVMNQTFGTKLSGNIMQIGAAKQNANQASTYQDARVGDLIYFYNAKKQFTHIAICMGTTSDAVLLYECNASGGTAQISYRSIPYSQVSAGRSGRYVTVFRAKNYDAIDAQGLSRITITFDPNGGSFSPSTPSTQVIEKGSDPRNLPTPTRSGYIFKGWALDKIDPDSSGSHVTGIATEESAWGFDKDTTLYALWEKERNKTFSVTLDDGSVCSLITVTNGGTYGSLPVPTKDGYMFDGWYTQVSGGTEITSSTKVTLSGDQTLYAHWSKAPTDEEQGYWGPWSDWSTTPVYASDTRQVETQTITEQVKISDGYTEYRYVGYATADGRHECWCETYLRNKFGSAVLRYSNWSRTRYSANGTGWTCGNCGGNHTGVDHYGDDGRAWWAEYTLPDGKSYYWEESRTTDAQYETREVTQYRYRDWTHS